MALKALAWTLSHAIVMQHNCSIVVFCVSNRKKDRASGTLMAIIGISAARGHQLSFQDLGFCTTPHEASTKQPSPERDLP